MNSFAFPAQILIIPKHVWSASNGILTAHRSRRVSGGWRFWRRTGECRIGT